MTYPDGVETYLTLVSRVILSMLTVAQIVETFHETQRFGKCLLSIQFGIFCLPVVYVKIVILKYRRPLIAAVPGDNKFRPPAIQFSSNISNYLQNNNSQAL